MSATTTTTTATTTAATQPTKRARIVAEANADADASADDAGVEERFEIRGSEYKALRFAQSDVESAASAQGDCLVFTPLAACCLLCVPFGLIWSFLLIYCGGVFFFLFLFD